MANWCFNHVRFHCSEWVMGELEKLFMKMAKKEKKENVGQLPDFISAATGYLFNIRWEDHVLCYDTKWCPNIEIIQRIADLYQSDFDYSYEELDMHVYGEYLYQHGQLIDICLDDADF